MVGGRAVPEIGHTAEILYMLATRSITGSLNIRYANDQKIARMSRLVDDVLANAILF
jgi:hypothetical protein